MNQVQQMAQHAFEVERAKTLSTLMFTEPLNEDFRSLIRKCLEFTSWGKCGCSLITYRGMINFDRTFFFPEVDLMVKIIRSATPLEMNQTLEENLQMIEKIVMPVFNQLNETDEQISTSIKRKIESQIKADVNVPIGKKIFHTSGMA